MQHKNVEFKLAFIHYPNAKRTLKYVLLYMGAFIASTYGVQWIMASICSPPALRRN